MNFQEMFWNMKLAQDEAEKAWSEDEVPVGAVVVGPQGKVLSKAHNRKEKCHDPTGHAELLAIRQACEELGNWRLEGCTLFVTLEPCPMCLAAMQQARIASVIFGAYDPKGGALSLGYRLHGDSRLNHSFSLVGGVQHFENSSRMSRFFRQKREFYKAGK